MDLSCFNDLETSNCCEIIHGIFTNPEKKQLTTTPNSSLSIESQLINLIIQLNNTKRADFIDVNVAVQLLGVLNKALNSNWGNPQFQQHYLSIIITLTNDLKKVLLTTTPIPSVDIDKILLQFQTPFKLLISSKLDEGLNEPAIKYFGCQLFGLYFKFNKIPSAINMFKVINNLKLNKEQSGPPDILFDFYLGKCLLIQNDQLGAYQIFMKCLNRLPKRGTPLRFKLLVYLLPLHVILNNESPHMEIFDEFEQLQILKPVYESFNNLSIDKFNHLINEYQYLLLKSHVYAFYVKMTNIIELRIFQRSYKVWKSIDEETHTHIVPLEVFCRGLKVSGLRDNLNEDYVESKLMGLISMGYIKGYISHGKRVIVLSKKEAFPLIRST